jgi:hypothetical protein
MADARLYLDGPYRQIPVGLGDRVVCSVSDEPLTIFGLGRRRDDAAPRSFVPGLGRKSKASSPRKKARRRPV